MDTWLLVSHNEFRKQVYVTNWNSSKLLYVKNKFGIEPKHSRNQELLETEQEKMSEWHLFLYWWGGRKKCSIVFKGTSFKCINKLLFAELILPPSLLWQCK